MYRTRGFTLIELLVVIAIIGMLSSIVIASLNSARAKARDAKRLADLHGLQLALELYYTTNNLYPPSATSTIDNTTTKTGDWPTAFKNELSPYMPKLPLDPLQNDGSRFYGAERMTRAPDANCNGRFVIWTYLETTGPPYGQSTCGWGTNHYMIILGTF